MSKKDGMYLYSDWLCPFEKLSAEEVGRLVIAMMRYFTYGEEPPAFDGLCAMAADFIFPQIDRSMEYAKLGSRGGAAKKGKRYQKSKDDPEDAAESADADYENGRAPEERKAEAPKADGTTSAWGDSALYNVSSYVGPHYADFEKFWSEYPRKADKQRAWISFQRLSPDAELFTKIMEGVKRQKKSKRWTKEGGQYVPYPANWLDGCRWDDVIEEEPSGSFDTDDFFDLAVQRAKEYWP